MDTSESPETIVNVGFTVGRQQIDRTLVNVPINDALMTWQASAPPADLREIWSRWEQAHTIRTIVSVVALVSSALAATVFSAQSDRRT